MNWNEEHLFCIPTGGGCGASGTGLVRATQGYTESVDLLVYSVALLMADWTSKLNTRLSWEYRSGGGF